MMRALGLRAQEPAGYFAQLPQQKEQPLWFGPTADVFYGRGRWEPALRGVELGFTDRLYGKVVLVPLLRIYVHNV